MEIKFELASEKRQQKSTSPTNVNAFPSEGWMTRTRPIACTISGRIGIGDAIGFNDYYFEAERVLCTRVFSTSAVGTTVDDGESPPGSTELDDETGHNCKMPHSLYRIFCTSALAWTPLGLLGYHSIGSGVQESNPTQSRRDDVLL